MRVLFTCQPGLGHWHPLVPLARAARDAGHDVAFASVPDLCKRIEAGGFLAFAAGADESEGESAERRKQLASYSPAEQARHIRANVFAGTKAQRSLPDLLRILRDWQPDLLVREDAEYAGCVAAEKASIPHAVVEVSAPRSKLLSIVDTPFRDLCASVGVACGQPADILYRYLWLSPRPPSLWEPEVQLPPNLYFFRQPSFSGSGAEELPEWASRLDKGRPTVYATLGTVQGHRTDILGAIVEAFQEEPVNLVLTVGRKRDPQDFGEQPPHMHIARYIPQSLLLPLCDLVVNHGGSGTMMDALTLGLPMVMLPINADQPENAERCARLGVARVVAPGEQTADAIRQATRAVLHDPSYRTAAHNLQKEIEGLPGLEYPVALLERLVAERTPLIAQPPMN